MTDPKDIAAHERAQADAEEAEAQALEAEASRLRARAVDDRAIADALDPPAAPAAPAPPAAGKPPSTQPNPQLPPTTGPVTPDPVVDPAPAPVDTGVPTPPPPAGDPDRLSTMSPADFQAVIRINYGYRAEDVPEVLLAAMEQTFPPGSTGNLSPNQTVTGAQSDIGLAPDFAAIYAMTMDPRALGNLKANVHCLPSYPVHLRTPDGQLAKPWEHPTAGNTSFGPDATATPGVVTDLQHQDHTPYVYAKAMQLRGDRDEFVFAREELRARVYFDHFTIDADSRQKDVGVINTMNSIVGLRGGGWTVAAYGQLFDILDPSDEAYPWLKRALEQTFIFYVTYFFTRGSWGFNNLGLFLAGQWNPDTQTYKAGDPTKYRAFMQAFMCQAILFVERLNLALSDEGKAALKTCADNASKWVVGITGPANTPGFYDYRRSPLYDIWGGTVRADQGADWPETFGELAGVYAGFKPMGPDDHLLRDHDAETIMGGLEDGFGANLQPAIAMVADRGYPGGADSWGRWESTRQYQQADVAWQFAVTATGRYIKDAPPAAVVTGPVASPAPVDTTPVEQPDPVVPVIEIPAPVITSPPEVSASLPAWADIPVGTHADVPVPETLRQLAARVLGADYGAQVQGLTRDWAGAAYFRDLGGSRPGMAGFASGHEATDFQPSWTLFLDSKPAFDLRNIPSKLHGAEPDSATGDFLDDASGFSPHTYNTLVPAYLSGKATLLGIGGGGGQNQIHSRDLTAATGGFGHVFPGTLLMERAGDMFITGEAQAAKWKDKLWFATELYTPAPWIIAIDQSTGDVKALWPNPIAGYTHAYLAAAEDKGWLFGVTGTGEGYPAPKLRILDLNTIAANPDRPGAWLAALHEVPLIGDLPMMVDQGKTFVAFSDSGVRWVEKRQALYGFNCGAMCAYKIVPTGDPLVDPWTCTQLPTKGDKSIGAIENGMRGRFQHEEASDRFVVVTNVDQAPQVLNLP